MIYSTVCTKELWKRGKYIFLCVQQCLPYKKVVYAVLYSKQMYTACFCCFNCVDTCIFIRKWKLGRNFVHPTLSLSLSSWKHSLYNYLHVSLSLLILFYLCRFFQKVTPRTKCPPLALDLTPKKKSTTSYILSSPFSTFGHEDFLKSQWRYRFGKVACDWRFTLVCCRQFFDKKLCHSLIGN